MGNEGGCAEEEERQVLGVIVEKSKQSNRHIYQDKTLPKTRNDDGEEPACSNSSSASTTETSAVSTTDDDSGIFQTPPRIEKSSSSFWLTRTNSNASSSSSAALFSVGIMPDPASPMSAASSATHNSSAAASRKEKRGGFFRRRKKKQDNIDVPTNYQSSPRSQSLSHGHSNHSLKHSTFAEEEKKEDGISLSIMSSASYGGISINEEGTDTTEEDERSSNTTDHDGHTTTPQASSNNRISFPDLLPSSSQSSMQQQEDEYDDETSEPYQHLQQAAAGDLLQPRPRASLLSPVLEQSDAVACDSMSTSSQVVSTLLATSEATATTATSGAVVSRSRATTPVPADDDKISTSSKSLMIMDLGDVTSPAVAENGKAVPPDSDAVSDGTRPEQPLSPSAAAAAAVLSTTAATEATDNVSSSRQKSESSQFTKTRRKSSSPISAEVEDQLAPPSLTHRASPTNSLQRSNSSGGGSKTTLSSKNINNPTAVAAAAAAAAATVTTTKRRDQPSTVSTKSSSSSPTQRERQKSERRDRASSPTGSQVQREIESPEVSPIAALEDHEEIKVSVSQRSTKDNKKRDIGKTPSLETEERSDSTEQPPKASPANSSLSQSPVSGSGHPQVPTPVAANQTTSVPLSIEVTQPVEGGREEGTDSGQPTDTIAFSSASSSPKDSLDDNQSSQNHSSTDNHMPPDTKESLTYDSTSAALALAVANSKALRKKTTADIICSDLWSPNLETVVGALKHITMEASSDKTRGLIARTGGLLAIVRAMEGHSSNSRVQVAGCQALEKLALDTENEIAIEQVGGVETILAAMMGHFKDEAVQEAAWAALWNLTCTNASKDMTLDTDGGMAAIVAAMKEHMDCPAVQKNACGALANLCQNNPKRMEAFVKANGFSVIATALQRYWDSDKDVRAEACCAMTALCEGSANQLHASRTTTITTMPPVQHVSATPNSTLPYSSASLMHSHNTPGSNGSVASANRGYLPQRFTGGGGGNMVPPSVLNTANLRQHLHYTSAPSNRAMDSDLHSLASLSYFEEEVFDD